MKLKLYILFIYFNIYSIYSQNFKYARELYFCITINKVFDITEVYIKNATLYSGKWTANRWSDTEISSPINKIIPTEYTICCKKKDNCNFGPTGTLEIHVREYTNSYNLYVWWDIAKLGYEPYGLSGGSKKPLNVINLEKNWIKLFI